MVGYEDPTFFIKGGDLGFADRQKNIFGLLSVAEKERNERQQESDHLMDTSSKSDNPRPVSRKRTRSQMKQFRGKESIFKKPDAPPPRFKNKGNIPDYQRNPHKWVKYSLGDVSQEDMSDRSNTAAALSFLREMEERKGVEKMEDDNIESKVSFRQPKFKSKLLTHHDSTVSIVSDKIGSRDSTVQDEKPSFRSTKVVMPEYVVGMTKKKQKKTSEKTIHLPKNDSITAQITLGHLMDEEDDE
ncbi:hypothetical protein C0J52_05420 [Blattella germanica]|nr:hypothetical protein C0J52_05420 [Blattella germanica]